MSFKKQLEKLRAQRAEKLAAANALHTKADGEGRTFNEDEQKSFDNLTGSVDAIDRQIKSTETMERMAGAEAGALGGDDGEGDDEGDAAAKAAAKAAKNKGVDIGDKPVIHIHRNLPKGTAFTRYAMALAASKGNLHQAAEVAKNLFGETTPEVARVLKAAVAAGTTTDATWARPLVEYRLMSEEFIELLRPQTILGRIRGLRTVPFNVRIPRQTSGASVGWVGEGNPKPVSKQGFDTVTMPEHKIAGIVVLTMELARFSSPSAEGLVRADMIQAISEFSDRAFIDPSLAGSSGISPASITNGVTAVASGGSTLAEIEADLMAAMLNFTNRNIPLSSAVWVMNPATRMALAWKRTAQDVSAFPGVDQGTLKGLPIVESNSVGLFDADGAGAGAASFYIALVSAENVMLADDGQVMLDSSSEASVSMTDDGTGTTLTSLWQRNMIGLRAERLITWLGRRANPAYVITGVNY